MKLIKKFGFRHKDDATGWYSFMHCTILAENQCNAGRFKTDKPLHYAQIRYPSFCIVQQIFYNLFQT